MITDLVFDIRIDIPVFNKKNARKVQKVLISENKKSAKNNSFADQS
jgi:hypothetical protein